MVSKKKKGEMGQDSRLPEEDSKAIEQWEVKCGTVTGSGGGIRYWGARCELPIKFKSGTGRRNEKKKGQKGGDLKHG